MSATETSSETATEATASTAGIIIPTSETFVPQTLTDSTCPDLSETTSVQPKLWKKHTEEESLILKEYIRITNREGLDWVTRLGFLLFDSRTNTAFVINVLCFLLTVYIAGLDMLTKITMVEVVCSYLFADLLSGMVHIYLDHSKVRFDGSYADFARMGFQVHHLYPTFPWLMDPHYEPYMECNTIFPYANMFALLNALSPPTIQLPCIPVACIMSVSFQWTHYYAHARNHNKKIPFLVEKLQDFGVILSPKGHQQHHTTFNTDFCILNGYMNWLCDWIVGDEKRLDSFVESLDGSIWKLVTMIVGLMTTSLSIYLSLKFIYEAMWQYVLN